MEWFFKNDILCGFNYHFTFETTFDSLSGILGGI